MVVFCLLFKEISKFARLSPQVVTVFVNLDQMNFEVDDITEEHATCHRVYMDQQIDQLLNRTKHVARTKCKMKGQTEPRNY